MIYGSFLEFQETIKLSTHVPTKIFKKFFWTEIYKIALYDHREEVVFNPAQEVHRYAALFFEKTAINYICVLFVPYFFERIYNSYIK